MTDKDKFESATGVERELADKVYKTYSNEVRDYCPVCGVLDLLKNDAERQRVINYIDAHPDAHISTLTLLALQIDQERQ